MATTPLTVEAARRTTAKLSEELGRTDRERLGALLDLIQPDSRINLGIVLEKLFPGMTREASLTAFRQFRKRIKDAAGELGLLLDLEVDTKKKDDPDQRHCWFVGDNGASDLVAQLIEDETDSLEHTDQDAIILAGDKQVIRYFISYAHKDTALKEDLYQRLADLFNISSKYLFEPWHDGMILPGDKWREQIQKGIENCDFGLLLVSPAFLGSDFITSDELPHFVPQKLKEPEGARRAIPVALKPLRFDGSIDLKGLQEIQVFHDREGKAYYQRTGQKKDEFVNDLFDQILRVVKERLHFDVKPDQQRHRLFEHQMKQHIEAQLEECCFIDTDGQSTVLDKMETEPAKTPQVQRINALSYLLDWSKNPDAPSYFALLGELGMGKTTTCLAFARELLARRVTDPGYPLPIYLDLRHLGEKAISGPRLEEILEIVLQRSWRGGRRVDMKAEEIIRLVQEQGAVALYDGLDEVLVHLTPSAGQLFLRELLRLLPPLKANKRGTVTEGKERRGRLLLTCRTHYFRSLREQKNLLMGEGREPIGSDDYRALVLLPFSEEQIIAYLRHAVPGETPERVMETIRAVHNLSEMAERPYTLSLIAQQIPQIERWRMEGRTVTGVTLYRHMVQSWLERDTGKHQLTPTHKQRLMEYFSAALWRSGRRTWKVEDVEQWLIDLFIAHPEIAAHYGGKNRELLKEDLRTATFLVREGEDHFRFAHTSLLEFFLACYLQRALVESSVDRWCLPLVSRETRGFLGQMLTEDEENRSKALDALKILLRDGYRKEGSEQALAYAIVAIGNDYPAPTMANLRMGGADLRGWEFFGNLNPLNLRGSNWRGARLDGARFCHGHLEGADFSEAILDLAEFMDCHLEACCFSSAHLAGTIFRDTNLARADFSGGKFHRAKFLKSALNEAVNIPNAPGKMFSAMCDRDYQFPPSYNETSLRNFASTGHPKKVCYSADGRHIGSAGFDGIVRLWDAATLEQVAELHGHHGEVNDVAFRGDCSQLASAGIDGSVRIWNAFTGDLVATLRGHQGGVNSIAFTGDGSRLASAGEDGIVRLWDILTGELVAQLRGHEGRVTSVASTDDGRRLTSGGKDGSVSLWDAATGKQLARLPGHEGQVNCVAFNGNGSSIASAGDDGTVRLWETVTGKKLAQLRGHHGKVKAVAFARGGSLLASVGEDGNVRLWDATTEDQVAELRGHRGEVRWVAFGCDGTRLASVGVDGMRVWDVSSREQVAEVRDHRAMILDTAFTGDGRWLLTAGSELLLWDTSTGEPVAKLDGHKRFVMSVAFAADGNRLASSGGDDTIMVWDAATWKKVTELRGHRGVISVALSGDGSRLASSGFDGSVRLWNVATGEEQARLRVKDNFPLCVAFAKDGARLAWAGLDGSVRLWDPATGEHVAELEVDEEYVASLAFSGDGTRLASAGADGSVRLWDTATGEQLVELRGHQGEVRSVAFRGDGSQLASAGADGTVRLWDLTTGKQVAEFSGGTRSLSFNDDGSRLACVGIDGNVRLWDTATQKEYLVISLFDSGSWAVFDAEINRLKLVAGDAWRWLGWSGIDPNTGHLERWPAEIYGQLPEWTPKGV